MPRLDFSPRHDFHCFFRPREGVREWTIRAVDVASYKTQRISMRIYRVPRQVAGETSLREEIYHVTLAND